MRPDPAAGARLPDATGLRIAIVVSRFNEEITSALRRGAEDALAAAGAAADAIEVLDVPGAFELPLAAQWAARAGRFDAVVGLGCVIRGETPHFEYISSAVAHGLAAVARETSVPVAFGVLTTETIAQARARAAPGPTNKGWEAAVSALEMAHLSRRLSIPHVAPGAAG
jgi:6,7-dimethyl-8-ribityllumazine synthase